MRNQLFFLALVATVFFNLPLLAQQPDIPKYGRDIEEHLSKSIYEIDSSANAVILFDKGVSSIQYNKEKGYFYLEITRHKRVKVLTKEGVKWADNFIPLHKSGPAKETLSRFVATTYNLEGGKVKGEKISHKEIFNEEVNKSLDLAKFTMPQVKEGSVFEFSYTVVSEFIYGLQPWEFQSEIPTLVSFYTVVIPEYFKYNRRISGYESIGQESSNSVEMVTFSNFNRSLYGQGGVASQTAKYETEWQMYYGYNLPAMRYEAYTDNINNYKSRIDFELQYTRFPGQVHKSYALNWNSVTNSLLEHANFGRELGNTSFLKEDIKSVTENKEDDISRLMAVFQHINQKIKWNNRYRLFTEKHIRQAYNEGSGNSSEVNLCLVAALKEAGFDTFPIALSTRSNGLVFDWEVSLSKFNHVIAGVFLNGKIIKMDATSNFSAPDILPLECLNGNARIIAANRSEWIDLNPTTTSRSNSSIKISFDESLEMQCKVARAYYNNQAINMYNNLFVKNDQESIANSLASSNKEWTVDSVTTSHSLHPLPSVKLSYIAKITDYVTKKGDIVYLSPGIGLLSVVNPFVSQTRKFPMNFHYPFMDSYNFVLQVPDGYEILEFPQNTRFALPEGKGFYDYFLLVNENIITVGITLSIGQTLFLPAEYASIKEFYDRVIASNNQMIVFKKTASK